MLVICCSSLFVVGLDSTIVNVALPSIGRDLHASVAGLQWTIDGYALVLVSLLMLSGATADRIGRRRVFLIGLAIFTAGSGLCSLATGLGWLIAFRMLQAIGGSMLNPVATSIITNTRLPMLAAGVGVAVGGVLLSRLTVSSGLLPLIVAFTVFGIGGGAVNALITYTAVSGAGISGRRGVRHRLNQPSDRPVPRHRRHRLDPGRESGRQPAAHRFRVG